MTEEQFNLPNSGLRWKGLALAHRSSSDVSGKRKKSKRHTSTDNEITLGSISRRLIGYSVGATFLVFLATAFFIYAW